MCVACICMCVCVCGSQRAGTILHSHGVWYFWRASRGLCMISVFKTQRKCYIESLLLVHKRIEKLFVKLKGPPYSCLLTTCLSSGSRIPIKILKPSISFSRRVEGEGQSVNLLSISSCASTIGCTTETLPVLFQCSTRTHIGWAGRRYGWDCALMNHTEAISMLVWIWKIPPKVAMPAYTVVAIDHYICRSFHVWHVYNFLVCHSYSNWH